MYRVVPQRLPALVGSSSRDLASVVEGLSEGEDHLGTVGPVLLDAVKVEQPCHRHIPRRALSARVPPDSRQVVGGPSARGIVHPRLQLHHP
eukprot:760482-Hanusia_phi.AAC.10